MESSLLGVGFRRAIATSYNPAKRRILFQPRRFYATPSQPQEPIRAAPPIRFNKDDDQFSRPRAEFVSDRRSNNNNSRSNGKGNADQDHDHDHLLRRIRIVPASPSYFTATPRFTDDLLYLSSLVQKYKLLPLRTKSAGRSVAWKRLEEYKTELGEPVRMKGYEMLERMLDRLNAIHQSLLPVEVQRALERYKRSVQPHMNRPRPIEIDELGRARAVGRRKSSNAVVFLVEGEGECLINGRTLTEYFGRLHDRESAMWPLKVTQRLDKYNVWALVKGGGTTGQAGAITLGVAKALVARERPLKSVLRKAGVMTRDARTVERKKAGKLKARKMPTWRKR